MNQKLSKSKTIKLIKELFNRKDFTPKEVKKTKKLAMKYRIRLKENKKKFCKKCLKPLNGKTRITKTHKTIICASCGYKNKFKLS